MDLLFHVLGFSILCLLSLFLLLRNFFRRKRIPPGTLGFPVIGETIQLISAYKSENPEPFIDERMKRFGPVFTTHVFGEPTVFSADQEVNRFILQNEGKLFEGSYPSSISNLLGRNSLVLMKGKIHKKMHNLTMSFANSVIIRDHFMVDIDRLIRLDLDMWSGRVLLMEETKKITFELALKQLMSFDPCEWTENLRKHYVQVIEGFFSVPYISSTYRNAIMARKKVADALTLVVRERRAEMASGNDDERKDMLAALLGGEGGGLLDAEIVDFILALLVAAYETTSTIMTLAVKFLTETPAALAQLKEEQDEIKARKGQQEAVEWSDYKSMAFTQSVINETLRVANIIGGIFRRATTDVQIKGYTIPKGWKVFASFRAVHLDQNNFKDARTFNPWRWQENEAGPTRVGGNIFTPFGGGPRLCPGYELARVELSVFLYHLITRFSWSPAEEDKLIFFPTTRMQKKYPINIKRRFNGATNT